MTLDPRYRVAIQRGTFWSDLATWRADNPRGVPDLSKADLRNTDLQGGDLSHTNLTDADLTGANLANANLCGADLRDADLSGAVMPWADLAEAMSHRAKFTAANLENATFCDGLFEEASFVRANLTDANFRRADFFGADLSAACLIGADFGDASFRNARLASANLTSASLTDAEFDGALFADACLVRTQLHNTSLRNAYLSRADLSGADLAYALLTGANLTEARAAGTNMRGVLLHGARLLRADLRDAVLENAMAIGTDFTGADLTGCHVYGLSAWDVTLADTRQTKLVITPREPHVHVDDLEVAQFIYLLLNRQKLRNVLMTLGERTVLILGRFTERKDLLDRIADKLRALGYLPIVFDFERPTDRDVTETIKVLAGLSLFVVADITNPRSVPLELQATVPDYMVPFVTLVERGQPVFGMFDDLPRKYDWALPLLEYNTADSLLSAFETKVVAPALEKLADVRRRKAMAPPRRSAEA